MPSSLCMSQKPPIVLFGSPVLIKPSFNLPHATTISDKVTTASSSFPLRLAQSSATSFRASTSQEDGQSPSLWGRARAAAASRWHSRDSPGAAALSNVALTLPRASRGTEPGFWGEPSGGQGHGRRPPMDPCSEHDTKGGLEKRGGTAGGLWQREFLRLAPVPRTANSDACTSVVSDV